jgi:hypothetical protein
VSYIYNPKIWEYLPGLTPSYLRGPAAPPGIPPRVILLRCDCNVSCKSGPRIPSRFNTLIPEGACCTTEDTSSSDPQYLRITSCWGIVTYLEGMHKKVAVERSRREGSNRHLKRKTASCQKTRFLFQSLKNLTLKKLTGHQMKTFQMYLV